MLKSNNLEVIVLCVSFNGAGIDIWLNPPPPPLPLHLSHSNPSNQPAYLQNIHYIFTGLSSNASTINWATILATDGVVGKYTNLLWLVMVAKLGDSIRLHSTFWRLSDCELLKVGDQACSLCRANIANLFSLCLNLR